jgi:hypothetical protein
MPMELIATVFGGILLSEDFMSTGFFAILAAFVAINTIFYASLAIAKIFPKIYPSGWFHGPNRRSETRSIHPDGS